MVKGYDLTLRGMLTRSSRLGKGGVESQFPTTTLTRCLVRQSWVRDRRPKSIVCKQQEEKSTSRHLLWLLLLLPCLLKFEWIPKTVMGSSRSCNSNSRSWRSIQCRPISCRFPTCFSCSMCSLGIGETLKGHWQAIDGFFFDTAVASYVSSALFQNRGWIFPFVHSLPQEEDETSRHHLALR